MPDAFAESMNSWKEMFIVKRELIYLNHFFLEWTKQRKEEKVIHQSPPLQRSTHTYMQHKKEGNDGKSRLEGTWRTRLRCCVVKSFLARSKSSVYMINKQKFIIEKYIVYFHAANLVMYSYSLSMNLLVIVPRLKTVWVKIPLLSLNIGNRSNEM